MPAFFRWSPRARRSVIAVTAAAVALTACTSGSSGGGPESPSPVAGGNLTFALASDPGCFDPQQVTSNDSLYVGRQLVDSLTNQDPDTGKIVSWLADSWQVSADATTFTFKLHKGATFSDGTPVTATSVKNNLDGISKLAAKAPLGSSYLVGYQQTDVVDDLTARVVFSVPSAQFLQASSTVSLGLLSDATLARTTADRCTNPVGSGPFTLQSYSAGQKIVLSKRTGYVWGSSLWSKKGEAYLDTVTFQMITDAAARTAALKSGQIDGVGGVPPQDEASLETAGLTLQAKVNPGASYSLQANVSRPVMADIAVRKAVQKAINRQEIINKVLSKRFKIANSVLSSPTPDYLDLGSSLASDVSGANKLLDDAGWKAGADGIRVKNGQRLEVAILWAPSYGPNQAALELIQQQLKQVGISVVLKQVGITETVAAVAAGDYDFYWANLTRADPDILRTLYSTKASNRSRLPVGGELDILLDQQAAAGDVAKRETLVHQAQKLIIDNAYAAPAFELTTVLGLSAKVHDLRFEASSRLQLHDTWLSN